MRNFKILVAGLYVTVSARFDLTYEICRPYLTDRPWSDITLYATPAMLKKKQQEMSVAVTEEQAECMAISELLSLKLLPHDAFLLHAAVVSLDGRTYAFCAPRGVGKSTHAAMWKQCFGEDNVTVINGDKPIIRRAADGRFYAWGTPFCGKEGWGTPVGAPLDCITFIERGAQDSVRLVTEREYLDRLIGQVVFPADEPSMNRGARLLADFMRNTPAALASCTQGVSAAKTVRAFWDSNI